MSASPLRPQKDRPLPAPDATGRYHQLLWLIVFANSLFLIPNCLDRYLAPRFLFLSVGLLAGLWLLRRDLTARADWRLHGFDVLLLGWYGLNVASVFWAFRLSEGLFFTQKVLLLFLVYWLVRQALLRDEEAVRRTLAQITLGLTFLSGGLILGQLVYAWSAVGLENEALYDYASGVFGNKGLASDFLFFLLIFNVLLYENIRRKSWFWMGCGLLLTLILLLQTRTVYLALVAAAGLYFPLRAWTDKAFRPVFWKKILPAAVVVVGLLAALVAVKGRGTSLAERLNPATYLHSASANERRFVWYKTDLLNLDHYWWGVGNGSWKIWFPSKNIRGAFRLEEKSIVFTRAHNDYLEIRAEMGMVGAVFFIALFGAAFLSAGWMLFRSPDRRASSDLAAPMAGLLGYCIIQYFDFPRERIEMQVMLAMLFAFTAHFCREFWQRLPGPDMRRYSRIFFLFAFAGLAVNIVIGYFRVRGEIHNVRLMQAMVGGDYPRVLQEARAARNPFYEYNDTAIPLQWFEGIGWLQLKEPAKAVGLLEEAVRLNPWSFQVLNNYASALALAKRPREALPVFERMLELNPRSSDGRINLAYTLLEVGDTSRAVACMRQVDTLAGPKTPADLARNRVINGRKSEFFRRLKIDR